MKVRSPILADIPGGTISAFSTIDDSLRRAIDHSDVENPSVALFTPGNSPNYVVDSQAFVRERTGQLGKAGLSLGSAFLNAVSPKAGAIFDGLVLLVGSGRKIAGAMADGEISAGEFLELTEVGLKGATAIRRIEGGDQHWTGMPAPETGLDHSRNFVGAIGKVRGAYLGLAPKDPTIFRSEPRLLAELAAGLASASPVVGAALTLLDVMTDEDFHRELGLASKPASLFPPARPMMPPYDFLAKYRVPATNLGESGSADQKGPFDNVIAAMQRISEEADDQ